MATVRDVHCWNEGGLALPQVNTVTWATPGTAIVCEFEGAPAVSQNELLPPLESATAVGARTAPAAQAKEAASAASA
jgi:hypothetical protein